MRMQLKQCGVVLRWLLAALSLAACNSQSEAPQHVAAVGADAEAIMVWDEVPGATSYNLYWNATDKASSADASTTNVTSPYIVTGLRNESTYYFRVTAVSPSGESVASPNVTARTTAVKLQSIVVAPKGQPAVPYANMLVGTKQYFAATGVYPDGSTIDISKVAKWSTSDTAVFTVIKEGRGAGLVTALQSSAGKVVNVSATYGGVQGSVNVNVGAGNFYVLGITPHDPTIAPRTSLAFSVLGGGNGDYQDYTATVVWSSKNPSVARISNELGSEGVAKALSVGTTVIYATFAGMTVESVLTVSDVALQSIAITPAVLAMPRGLTQRLQANGSYSDGSTRDITDKVLWSSSNPLVAPVETYPADPNAANLSGTVSTYSQNLVGSTVITARFQTFSADSVVTITPPETLGIKISPASVVLTSGGTQQLNMGITTTDGTGTYDFSKVVWTSSNPAVVQVDSIGMLTAVAPGQAIITLDYLDGPGFSTSANVDVRLPNIDHTQVTGTCISCHDGNSASGKSSTHVTTTNQCELCHIARFSWLVVTVDHAQVFGTCVSCHISGGQVKTFKPVTHLPTTNACDACHITVRWSPAIRVDHTQVFGTCTSCHNGITARGKGAIHPITTADCNTCHIGTQSWFIPK